jgi:hypothetical protein
MIRYAQWLAGHPGAELAGSADDYRNRFPKGVERSARASEYAGRPIQRQLIGLLEKRPDLRSYFERLQADLQFHAKERAQSQLAKNFEARDQALDMAVEARDYRAIGSLSDPWVQHGMPKIKADADRGAQKIVINMIGMTPEQKKLLTAGIIEPEEPDEIEWEVIETEKTAEEDE